MGNMGWRDPIVYASDAENTICRFFTPVYALPRMETLFWFATATWISHLVLFFKEPVIFSTHFGLERRRGEDKALFLCVICLYMSSHSDPQVLTPSPLKTGWGGGSLPPLKPYRDSSRCLTRRPIGFPTDAGLRGGGGSGEP